MKFVDEPETSELKTQMAFSFESSDISDQSYLPVPAVIESAQAFPLRECNVVAFRRQPVSSAEAGLLARILQRTRYFV